MPRRSKHPPRYDLSVEKLSGNADVVQPVVTYVDDFTGETKPMHPQVVQARVEHAKVITDYRERINAVKAAAEAKMIADHERMYKSAEIALKRKGILPSEPKLAHNQTKLGDHVATPIVQRKPWRRM